MLMLSYLIISYFICSVKRSDKLVVDGRSLFHHYLLGQISCIVFTFPVYH